MDFGLAKLRRAAGIYAMTREVGWLVGRRKRMWGRGVEACSLSRLLCSCSGLNKCCWVTGSLAAATRREEGVPVTLVMGNKKGSQHDDSNVSSFREPEALLDSGQRVCPK